MQTEIINRALVKIGERPISSVNEEPWGESCGILYESTKRFLLSSYPWRFAIKRVILTPLDEKSENERFKNVFELPADCLLFVEYGTYNKPANLTNMNVSKGTIYEIEENKLYSNEMSPNIKYVSNREELFTETFKEAFACKLASELAYKITQNFDIKQVMQNDFMFAISLAQRQNEIIADTEEMPENTWVAVRENWSGYEF